jgi:hypothetical protein
VELQTTSPTAKGPASTFTGDVYVTPIYFGTEPSRMTVALVRFTGSSHFSVMASAAMGVHAARRAALASRIRTR